MLKKRCCSGSSFRRGLGWFCLLGLTLASGCAADGKGRTNDETDTGGATSGASGAGAQAGGAGAPPGAGTGGVPSGAGGSAVGPPGAGGSAVKPPAPPAGPGVIEACTDATQVKVARTPLRRVSRAEFNNVARDLFGDTSKPARDGTFPPDERVGSFVSNSVTLPTPVNNEQILSAVEAVGKGVVTRLVAATGCTGASDTACIERFLSGAAQRAFRGGWDAAAESEVLALYRSALPVMGAEGGFETAVEGILIDPRFLYVMETGTAAGSVSRLSGRELAGRLAAYLWRSVPSKELLAAADAQQLSTREDLRKNAASMLDDPRARSMLEDFALQWLHMDTFDRIPASGTFTEEVRTAMRAEAVTTISNQFMSGTFSALLTAPAAPADVLKAFYGPGERPGILTNGAVLASNISPIKRGRMLRQQLMCDTIPEPPDGITRELGKQNQDVCWGCHKFMDPVGAGFAYYDTLGRYTPTPSEPTAGEFVQGPYSKVVGKFTGAPQMTSMLATDATIQKCFATQVMRYALGRSERIEDACSLSGVYNQFVAGNLNIRELLLAIVSSDAFIHRNTVLAGSACQ